MQANWTTTLEQVYRRRESKFTFAHQKFSNTTELLARCFVLKEVKRTLLSEPAFYSYIHEQGMFILKTSMFSVRRRRPSRIKFWNFYSETGYNNLTRWNNYRLRYKNIHPSILLYFVHSVWLVLGITCRIDPRLFNCSECFLDMWTCMWRDRRALYSHP